MTKISYFLFFAVVLSCCFLCLKTCDYFFFPKKITEELSEVKSDSLEPSQKLVSESEKEPSLNFLSEKTREILKPPCGKCHQSSLESSLAAALAFFDLDEEGEWYGKMKPENFEGVTNRVKNNKGITEEDKVLVNSFIDSLKK